MIGRATDMLHVVIFHPLDQIAGNIARAVVRLALKTQWEEDVHSLFAGNVDRAVAFAFTVESDKPKK